MSLSAHRHYIIPKLTQVLFLFFFLPVTANDNISTRAASSAEEEESPRSNNQTLCAETGQDRDDRTPVVLTLTVILAVQQAFLAILCTVWLRTRCRRRKRGRVKQKGRSTKDTLIVRKYKRRKKNYFCCW